MASDRLEVLARQVRRSILTATTSAGSGHPTSSLSAADLLVTLMFGGFFRADLNRPQNPNNDRLIFSKGHAAPLLYALYAAAGKVSPRELFTLRKFGSRLEGHPMPSFPYTEVPTGSLGQGLSAGVGMAIAARMDRLPYRTFVLLGDSEISEGSVWEAVQLAAFRKLDNLVGILDCNRLGQSGPTMLGHNVAAYQRRLAAFGWATVVTDGHDWQALRQAYRQALSSSGRPVMIIAKTIKGKGVSFLENRSGWHGKPLTREQLRKALAEIEPLPEGIRGVVRQPATRSPRLPVSRKVAALRYKIGETISPRRAFGNALVRLAPGFPQLVVLDGEVMNSTYTESFAKQHPRRFIQCYIAEQNMAGMAAGLANRGKLSVAATFAAFWSRSADQLRMNGYAESHQVYIGTHAGVSIGPDGPSQMGLGDLTLFRSLHGSSVFYPADAVSAEKLLDLALRGKGIVYLRATRNELPVIYRRTARFVSGGSTVLRQSRSDKAAIVSAGITLHEALTAADELAKSKVSVRVIDLYSLKPIDVSTLKAAARQTKHLIVVEDHGSTGGLGEAVRSCLGPLAGTVTSLAVTKLPRSGTTTQLLRQQGIDAAAIVRAVKRFL